MDVDRTTIYQHIANDLGAVLAAEKLDPDAYYVSVRDTETQLPVEYYSQRPSRTSFPARQKTMESPSRTIRSCRLICLASAGAAARFCYMKPNFTGFSSISRCLRTSHFWKRPPMVGRKIRNTLGPFRRPPRLHLERWFGTDRSSLGYLPLSQQPEQKTYLFVIPYGMEPSLCIPPCRESAYDLAHGIHSTFGNLFFTEGAGRLALFELSLIHKIPAEA